MVINPDIRIKIRDFLKKNLRLIIIILAVWLGVIGINNLIQKMKLNKVPTTTYKPHTSIMDENSYVPKKVQNSMEDFVKQYIEYCNNGELEKAYNMISEECKNENFDSFSDFEAYISNKFNGKKNYTIQNYSNYNDKYIYTIKLYDDILKTGLTNSTYNYQEEKITAGYDKDNKIVFSVGNFIEKKEIQSVQENDYIKVDVKSKTTKYSLESYEVKITNKSDEILVIKNGQINDEILLNLGNDYRKDMNNQEIVILPNEYKTVFLIFNKFYDDGINSKSIIFNSIRVVENYIPDNANEENSIYKFSMELGLE